ncbi:hypothetical protein [Bacillus thermotolerans]|uniref:Uncharacterized protein n=1 Tax=Bacillus thermotolerans TaxID=1221996 RepID=A0A0F5HUY4_BACTR|nr:hypothetical protein [Bacillus thermotolerans]KKB36657.1 hypothetical protein QY97_00829 [Bacillus thermotolerans]KKB39898.1 hypothetical protein QY96_02685 [Bacillus thermotolerans]KKB40852.1 hypothetical protein QY95_01164 [Bacillus thermotolerans]
MNINRIVQKAKQTLNQASQMMKDKKEDVNSRPKKPSAVSVSDLAEFITNHPEANIERRNWLGAEYTFYNLKYDGAFYYLEKKDNHILQLDVTKGAAQILSYRSYRDQPSTPITSFS